MLNVTYLTAFFLILACSAALLHGLLNGGCALIPNYSTEFKPSLLSHRPTAQPKRPAQHHVTTSTS